MKPQASARRTAYLILASAIFLTGIYVDNYYYLQLFIFIGINTLLALSLNLLMGYTGQISLGHAAFFGIGAYTSAVLTVTYGWPPVASLPAAIATAVIIACIVGIPTLRLHGYYLGMGTLGVGMIFFILFREWRSVTGGASGFVGIPPLYINTFSFSDPHRYFYLVWSIVLLSIIALRRIIESRVGRALRAIHDHEKAAQAMGIDTQRLKLQVFMLSAAMAALAGFLYAHLVCFISPETFSFIASIRMVTMVVIGGMASIWGALFGAALLTVLPEYLHAFADFEMTVYGLILMLVMIFLPQGLTRGIVDLFRVWRRKA